MRTTRPLPKAGGMVSAVDSTVISNRKSLGYMATPGHPWLIFVSGLESASHPSIAFSRSIVWRCAAEPDNLPALSVPEQAGKVRRDKEIARTVRLQDRRWQDQPLDANYRSQTLASPR